jgi:hypothetical protein
MRQGAFLMRYRWLLLVLFGFFCLIPQISSAQGQLINGDRTLVGTLNFGAEAGSTGDTYVAALNPAITTYIPGARYLFKAPNASTAAGGTTLNLNGVGAKTIVKVVGGVPTTLADNDIRAGQYVEVVYDNTGDNFQILSVLGNAGVGNVSTSTSNTWTTGAQDMGLATSLKVPTSAGAGPTANGLIAYDSTANALEVGINTVNATVTLTSALIPKTAGYTVLVADFDTFKTIPVASGTFQLTLPALANQPSAGKFIRVVNYGTGVVTIARVDTNLNGGTAPLVIPASSATAPTTALIMSDGANYFGSLDSGRAKTRTCMMVVGAENGAALVDADLGPQLHQCTIDVPMSVLEIRVSADAGTPNVIIQRRTIAGTPTALLSSALTTAAAGAVACSKTSAAGTASYDGTTVCSTTLQNNTAMPAGTTLGLTSGTAGGTAKRMSVAVTMTID